MFKIKPFNTKSTVTYEKTKKNTVQIHVVNGDDKKEIKAFVFPSEIAGAIARANK